MKKQSVAQWNLGFHPLCTSACVPCIGLVGRNGDCELNWGLITPLWSEAHTSNASVTFTPDSSQLPSGLWLTYSGPVWL